ncbi:integral membrane protein [Apiospora hydei]|uniref:Integral membrane protein n=1 Tax=Apiospora hydei TaxID=1337664 RepID=A0ABR1XDE3_9PEZI
MASMDGTMDLSKLPDKFDQTLALITLSSVLTSMSNDILIFISTLFTIGYLICLVLARDAGLGHSILTLTIAQMETLLKLTYAIEIMYYVIIIATKCSIVAMYYNIALSQSFRITCHATHALLAVFFVVCISVTFGQCQPLSRQWDPTLAPAARAASCINTTAFFYFTSAFNILMDLWILAMPLRTLRALQIRRGHRLVLYGVFGAFVFATAMSCVRLYSIYTYTLAEDPFLDGNFINVWSMVEINVGIICASVPALKPLFTPKRLLAHMRGEDPNAGPIGVRSGSSDDRFQKKAGVIQHHHAGGASDVDLSALEGGAADKVKRPSTSTIAIRLDTATSRKHLVAESIGDGEGDSGDENTSSPRGSGGCSDREYPGRTKVSATRASSGDDDEYDNYELQKQSPRRV